MSLQRLATPALVTTLSAVRAPQPSQTHKLQICLRCFRSVSPLRSSQAVQRRQGYASTAYRSQALATQQAPPRNAGIPETSIAGGKSEVDFDRTQQPPPTPTNDQQTSKHIASNAGIPESEAQQSKPAAESSAPPVGSVASEPLANSQAKPQRKSKLRPRKAAITLTPPAVAQLRGLLDQPEPKMIRIGVKNRGCSGLAYHLEYVDKPSAFDEAVDQDGVKVLVDSKALFSIIGSEMDWVEDKLNQRFVFNNPNIQEQCGCGESFSVG